MHGLHFLDVVTPAAAGGAGVSTATVTSDQSLAGAIIEAISIVFSGTAAPATTDVTVTLLGSGGFSNQVLLTRSNLGTNDTLYPRKGAVDPAGAAITNSGEKFVGSGRIQVDVAQADVGTIAKVRVWYTRG